MDHDGHRARLRERFRRSGLEAFSDHDKLELLLTYAIPRKDTKAIAYALMQRFGSFHAVLQADEKELAGIDGIGDSAATLLCMMIPMFRAYRMSLENVAGEIRDTGQAIRWCEAILEGEKYEKFVVLCLDARMRKINAVPIASGDVTEVKVYARHLVSALTQCGAVGAIITHNHPGGSPQPTEEDILLTVKIDKLLEEVGIRLYDHIIVGEKESLSFHRSGLLHLETADGKNQIDTARQGSQREDRCRYDWSVGVENEREELCGYKTNGDCR